MNNFYLSCKECVLDGPRNFYGCFYLGPFNNSQSLTIANALRRTLLSEISGLGIVSVQIEGVEHEYSTFLGIRESVLDLLLNLKEIVLCFSKAEPNFSVFNVSQKQELNRKNQAYKKKINLYSGYLQAIGPGVVRASDLKLPSFLKCVDSNQYIATLAENGKLNLKVQISKNNNLKQKKNFTSFPKNFLNCSKVLHLDPVFTPIKKVNYKIENYGTLNLSSNNQIVQLELWTNGSIHPRTAVYEALSLLSSTFSKLEKMKILNDVSIKSILKFNQNYSKIIKKNLYNLNFTRKNLAKNRLREFNKTFKAMDSFDKLKLIYFDKKEKKLIDQSTLIKDLNLPFRIENCLIQQNILTLSDLFLINSSDLEQIHGLNNQSIVFVQKKLFLLLTK